MRPWYVALTWGNAAFALGMAAAVITRGRPVEVAVAVAVMIPCGLYSLWKGLLEVAPDGTYLLGPWQIVIGRADEHDEEG